MATIYYLPTWVCENCGYNQDFEPTDDALVQTHIRDDSGLQTGYGAKLAALPAGVCPQCFLDRDTSVGLPQTTDTTKMRAITAPSPAEVAVMTTGDTNADGSPKMVASGESNYQMTGLDANNQPIYTTTPIMVQAQRPLTQAEQDAMNSAIQQEETQLQQVAVKVVTT